MLFEFRLTFSGYLDAPPSIVAARKKLIEDLRANPEKYISGIRAVEPTETTLIELGKRVLGLTK